MPLLSLSPLLTKSALAGAIFAALGSTLLFSSTPQIHPCLPSKPMDRTCKPQPLLPTPSPMLKSITQIREVHHLSPRFTRDVMHAAHKAHVSPVLVAAIIRVETGNLSDPGRAVSSAGAIGPMQLMPSTAWRSMQVNPWIPSSNILGGARYIASLIHLFHGHLVPALAAYNVGAANVLHWGIDTAGNYYAHRVLHFIHQSQQASQRTTPL